MDEICCFGYVLSSNYTDENGNQVEIFDDEKIEDTWKIMHGFVKQSILYIHSQREMVDGEYTKDYFPNVNIKENGERWKVKAIV